MKLKLTKEQIEQAIRDGEITIEVPKEKWEPQLSHAYYVTGHNGIAKDYPVPTKNLLNTGSYRKTKKQAEQLAELRRKQSRLHAFVCEMEGDDAGWKDGEDNYYIFLDKSSNKWLLSSSRTYCQPDTVYMRKETAKKAIEMINKGTLEL